MSLAPSRAGLVLALLLSCAAHAAGEGPAAELREVTRLYRDFEYEKALAKIAEADRKEGPTAVKLTILEGIIYGELNKRAKSVAAFRRALKMDSTAKLPFEVAPKVSEYFRAAQAEIEEDEPKAPLVSERTERAERGDRETELEAEPTLRDSEPGRPGSRPKIKAAALGMGEVLGHGVGAGLDFGIEWAGLDAGVRLSFGSQIGVGLELEYLFNTGRLRPLLGVRGWFFPGLSAFGGGPVAGAELAIVSGLFATADVAAEFYSSPSGAPSNTYQAVGVVFTLGLGYAF